MRQRSTFVCACLCALLTQQIVGGGISALSTRSKETLVLYNFYDDGPASAANLQFFLQHGVIVDDAAADFIILQSAGLTTVEDWLPRGNNVRFLHREAPCHELGNLGWLLRDQATPSGKYAHFILLNSRVRGPILPPYAQGRQPWHALFTRRLTGNVHMVGPTVTCRGSAYRGVKVEFPHIQPHALAIDRAALDILLGTDDVMRCWSERAAVVYHAEVGAAAAVLKAGGNLDCFLERYQGIDWRQPASARCNMQQDPQGNFALDGVTVLPYEIMFPLIHAHDDSDTSSVFAKQYTDWMDAARSRSL